MQFEVNGKIEGYFSIKIEAENKEEAKNKVEELMRNHIKERAEVTYFEIDECWKKTEKGYE